MSRTFHALILAGGGGRRMGGQDKGLAEWRGLPLIDHVIGRIADQVQHIAVSANRNIETYAERTPHVFPDSRQWQDVGPLAALATAANDLQLARADWLLIVPCDTPNLPDDIVGQFLIAVRAAPQCRAFYAVTESRAHYGVMFVRPQVLKTAATYLGAGLRTIRDWLEQNNARAVLFDEEDEFANINSLQDLQDGQ